MTTVLNDPNTGYRDSGNRLVYLNIIRSQIKPSAVTVTSTAGGTKLPTTPLTGRLNLSIYNNGSVPIYYGDSTVTSSTGTPILPQSSVILPIEDGVDVYAITASSTADVRLMESL